MELLVIVVELLVELLVVVTVVTVAVQVVDVVVDVVDVVPVAVVRVHVLDDVVVVVVGIIKVTIICGDHAKPSRTRHRVASIGQFARLSAKDCTLRSIVVIVESPTHQSP